MSILLSYLIAWMISQHSIWEACTKIGLKILRVYISKVTRPPRCLGNNKHEELTGFKMEIVDYFFLNISSV